MLPADSGLAFVVVQHLGARHPSSLPELLSRATRMPVARADDGARPEPNHVYVIAPGTGLRLEGGALRVEPREGASSGRIDAFLASLALDRGERAIGVILSGAGDDGIVGLRAIHDAGGLGIAQDPDTAAHASMPRTAIDAGLVDHVLPVESIPAAILAHVRQLSGSDGASGDELAADVAMNLRAVSALLHRRTGHDFGGYKEATLLRRVLRRVRVQRAASASDYLRLLEHDPAEPQRLLKDLLIGVTEFFRDEKTFGVLARDVLAPLLDGKSADVPIRIWVAGCASGEEAYSIAMLVHEHLGRKGSRRTVQIFATDLDSEMIAAARAGRYPADIADHVSPERLERFFVRDGASWRVGIELRDTCVFSVHSLIRDPPFSTLDLISCRNVLIYLGPELQSRVLPIFHFALRSGGHLLLGPAESLAHDAAGLFETVDKKHRVFRRKETIARPQVEFPLSARSLRTFEPGAAAAPAPTPPQEATAAIERMLLDDYAPPCAVVDERGDIAFVAGRIGRFLTPPAGAPTSNLLDAVRDSLRREVRAALHAAATRGGRVVRGDVPVELEDGVHRVRLTVRPVPGAQRLFAVVLQERVPGEVEGIESVGGSVAPAALEQIETELRATRGDLKTAVEAAEAANEELRSSNEELVSTNEELQSANEELQTSKEELQSLNEELETVNAELHRKVDELAVANGDLQNLFASTDIATIFLDRDLRVARFTPAATALFHFIETDVGRPIADLAPRFDGHDLLADAREVLSTLAPVERQVREAKGSRWFILRVVPYRTIEGVVAGAVLTFVDVSALKRVEEELRAAHERAEWLASFPAKNPTPIVEVDSDGRVRFANRAAERLFPELSAAGREHPFLAGWDEVVRVFRDDGASSHQRVVRVGETSFEQNMYYVPETGCIRLYAVDVTSRTRAEDSLRESEERYSAIHDNAPLGIALSRATDGAMTAFNGAFLRLFEFSRDELLGKTSAELGISEPGEQAGVAEEFRRLGAVRDHEVKRRTKSGRELVLSLNLDRVRIRGEELVLTTVQDVTARRRAEEALRESEALLRAVTENLPEASVVVVDPDLRCRMAGGTLLAAVGVGREALRGRTLRDVYDPETAARAEARFRRALAGEAQSYESEFRGRTVWTRYVPLADGEGRTFGALALGVDFTDRKRSEEERERVVAELNATLASITDGVVVYRPDGSIAFLNPAAQRLSALPPRSGDAPRPEDGGLLRLEGDDGAPYAPEASPASRALRGETVRSAVTRLQGLDGADVWLSTGAAPMVTSKGDRVGAVAVFSDVTSIKRAEAALKRSREGLSRLADASLSVIGETDLQGMLQAISEAALALTGARHATCGHGYVAGRFTVGGSARTRGAPACPPGDMFLVERGGVHLELSGTTDAVRLTDAELRAHPRWWGAPKDHVPLRGLLGVRMVGRNGATSGVILVTDKEGGDFTEEDESLLRQLATIASLALQHVEARISLEESDRSKNHFLAVLSHELRNPLAPIRNSVHLLERAPSGSEQAARAQKIIDRQVAHLTRLVDDLLDVTRISRGKVQVRVETLELGEVVGRAAEDHRASFTNGGVRLEVSVPERPLWIRGDRTRVAQILGNLLENAAKFTERGGVASLALERNDALGQAVIRVRDTGAGISPELLSLVFEPFVQAEATLARSKGGLGLGLALVKGLVEMHAGTVSVASEGVGKGTEFTVRLPLAAGPERPDGAVHPSGARGPRRVLVIEDNVDAARSLREVLALGGHEVDVAFSGPDGIEKARAFGPDVVLCDIGLPGMDGYQVARALRADPALARARLIALTGYAAPEDLALAREAGFHAHVAKPPRLEILEETLYG